MALGLLVGLASHASAQGGPAATLPGAGGMSAGTWSPRVKVFHISESAGRQEVQGAEVILEKWTSQPRGGLVLAKAQVAKTDSKGMARFGGVRVRRGESYVATTLHDGLTYSTFKIDGFAPKSPLELNIYERTDDTKELKLEAIVELRVLEAMIAVRLDIRLHNPTQKVIDLREGEGLRLPLALPAIGEEAWTGYLPTEKAMPHIHLLTDPKRGRLVLKRGGVYYLGPIFPGRGHQRIGIAYGIPINSDKLDLAFQSDQPLIQLRIAGSWKKIIAPRLMPATAFDVEEDDLGDSVARRMKIREPAQKGETLTIRLDRLPYALSAESNLAFYGGSLLFGLFFLFVLIGRRRA